jgi:site-specific DNA recombinase
MDNRFDRFTKGVEKLSAPKTAAVIYTRVSTKEQADNNASLDTQLKHCKKYAEENNLTVVEYFGGTYESAKNDERKQFQKMLTYVKQRKSIGFVIVYSYDRFSRSGPGGAFISHELKQKGIQVISATQSVDYSDPSGNFMEGIYHLFSQFDNQLRRDKSMTGMTEKLKQGYWPFIPPTGYDNLNQGKTADQHQLVINEKGKLLKKAFEWKAKKDMSLVEIAKKLDAHGWKVPHKRLSHFFQNPFYCGYIVSKMVPGEMIEGKHVPLITKSTFLKVHENLSKFHSGYKIQVEADHLPLKQFIKCDCCGTSFTGYTVKKKNLHYYKCNKTACKKNRSQKVLHAKFEELMATFQYDEEIKETLKEMLLHVVSKQINKTPSDDKSLEMQLAELKKKQDAIEERFVTGEIEQEMFVKFRDKFCAKIEQIEKELHSSKNSLSNLEKAVEKAVDLALNLPQVWKTATFSVKRKLQEMVFPQGIRYNREKDDYRTTRINLLFSAIPYLVSVSERYKKGDSVKFNEIPTWVGPPGLEPGTL